MDDRQLLEEHALQRARLIGMFLHGTGWREKPNRGALRRLLVGLLLGALVCAAIAAAGVITDRLGQGGGLGQGIGGSAVTRGQGR